MPEEGSHPIYEVRTEAHKEEIRECLRNAIRERLLSRSRYEDFVLTNVLEEIRDRLMSWARKPLRGKQNIPSLRYMRSEMEDLVEEVLREFA